MMTPRATAYAAGRSVGEKVDDAAITAKLKTKLVSERAKDLGVVHERLARAK